MGIWQLFAAANILGHPIRSVFPLQGSESFRRDFNQMCLPTDGRQKKTKPIRCYNVDSYSLKWSSAQFCTLITVHSKSKKSVELMIQCLYTSVDVTYCLCSTVQLLCTTVMPTVMLNDNKYLIFFLLYFPDNKKGCLPRIVQTLNGKEENKSFFVL